MDGADPGPTVLFVGHTGEVGGAERVLLDVAAGVGGHVLLLADGPLRAALEARGVPCTVAAGAPDLGRIRRDRPLAGSVLRVARGLLRTVRVVAAAAKDADLVYANSQKAFVVSAFAARRARRPLLWHLHDILDDDHFGTAQRRLVTALANRRCAAVVVPSVAAGDAFVAAGGRRALVHVVANGVGAAPGSPSDRATLRRGLGLPDGPVVGVFSRIAPWKGQHVAVAAVAAVPGAHLLLVGGPAFAEDAALADLHRLVARLDLADRVTFLGHRDDVRELMPAVDVCVHPSVAAEPFGLTVVEAMLAGLPVVASSAGALPEILTHGETGLLVPPGDAEALAAAVAELASDPGRARRMGERARSVAAERFSSDRLVAGVDAVVRSTGARGPVLPAVGRGA
ncbi:glycosyltransferase family 4 protein [Pseudonocardia sp. KRD-184]|uniref:Glycosyltransferase family 4 protein n=1 Tax=Pseudonocardia oceani TaxID=2792013 RepID=A0ABS6U656_9PSEU|nr:glycosyltransferase family 4 protein [Pseudonocardia oceani]MBW0088896.1 glycosyltransferase family 4 protein [Pseudonocardia oceani]MBW0095875.1 glycosyltransferase family 4 protein [Pseudonocardia oceani]MBW0108660.1 glycosyltransferase family 4 protein [Pseudonocardia oceani]MBW0122596.1 glycosyltransferase family 4 protein [Pseudonocardia oceani]MBW0127720.1 glycosyltransferase family 4 protein [Pseudonocardia oceani]